jgi:hypothetical protein
MMETDDLLGAELATPREKAVENAVIVFVFVKESSTNKLM